MLKTYCLRVEDDDLQPIWEAVEFLKERGFPFWESDVGETVFKVWRTDGTRDSDRVGVVVEL